jgi:putative glutamine amidotransferase
MAEAPLLIGLSARLYTPGSHGELTGVFSKTLHYLEQSMAHWVLSAPAVVVMVPAVASGSEVLRSDLNLSHYAAALDGLVLQGGNDIDPVAYGQAPLKPEWGGDRVRDVYEMELVQAFLAAGKPVLGVCRGLQLLNVMHGGSLWQDIGEQRPGSLAHRQLGRYEQHFHNITLVPGSRLAALCAGGSSPARRRVNSIHHQGIRELAPGFHVEARCADDGLIEAIRREGPTWVAGVQWHPEFHGACQAADPALGLFDDSPLLLDFLAACGQARQGRNG